MSSTAKSLLGNITTIPTTKRPARTQTPNEQEMNALDLLRRIREGQIQSQDEITAATLATHWKETALALFDAHSRGGEKDYWKAFDALSVNSQQLKDWKGIVEISSEKSPDTEKPKEQPYLLHPLSFFKNMPQRVWGVDHLLYDRGTSAWVGDGGSGKSALVLDMMLSRAYGRQFIGRAVKQGFIVWVAAESVDEIYPRVYAWQLHHGVSTDQEPNIWFLDERVPFNNMPEVELFIESIKAQAKEMNVTIDGFVFDTYARCTPGADENNTQEAKIILESITRISREFDTHVAIIHHTNTSGKIRGSTVLKNDVDTAWTITKDSGTIKMHCEKMRGAIEPPDFHLKMVSQLLSETDLENTAPVVVAAESDQSETTPRAQLQILEILQAHGKLSCNAWAKHCRESYQIADRTFYAHRKTLLSEGLIETQGELTKGKAVYYALSAKGANVLG